METILEQINTIENMVTKLGKAENQNNEFIVALNDKEKSLLTDMILRYVMSLKASVILLTDINESKP